jgi:L-fuconate dehydratase
MKDGMTVESDLRRGRIIRSVIDDPGNLPPDFKERDPKTLEGKNAGPTGSVFMIDANQVWDVPQAIDYVKQLEELKPWYRFVTLVKYLHI